MLMQGCCSREHAARLASFQPTCWSTAGAVFRMALVSGYFSQTRHHQIIMYVLLLAGLNGMQGRMAKTAICMNLLIKGDASGSMAGSRTVY